MIIGQVTSEHEAVLTIRLRSLDGAEIEVEVILDTGFTDFLTMPAALIRELSWPRRDSVPIILSDGSPRRVDVHAGHILWNGDWRIIPVQASEGDPLLGMALLHENFVSIEVISGGAVSIESIE